MTTHIYVLMNSLNERIKIGLTSNLADYFAADAFLVDPEQSRALALSSEVEASAALAALHQSLAQFEVSASASGAPVNSRWFTAQALIPTQFAIDDLRTNFDIEVLRIDEFLPATDLERSDVIESLLEANRELPAAASPQATLPVEQLLAVSAGALSKLRSACGANLALLPVLQGLEGRATHALVGMFGAEQFSEAMAALGVLELGTGTFFAAQQDTEIARVRQDLDWAFCVDVIRPTMTELSCPTVATDPAEDARRRLARMALGIAGWDQPMDNEILLSAVRETYFNAQSNLNQADPSARADAEPALRRIG
jgi:hypothetical protein